VQHAQALAALTACVRQSLSRDDVEGAARQLAGSSEQLAATPEWKALKAETDERRDYLKALEKARQLAAGSQFGEADQILAPLVKAGHKRAAQMQRTISQQRTRPKRKLASASARRWRRASLSARNRSAGRPRRASSGSFLSKPTRSRNGRSTQDAKPKVSPHVCSGPPNNPPS